MVDVWCRAICGLIDALFDDLDLGQSILGVATRGDSVGRTYIVSQVVCITFSDYGVGDYYGLHGFGCDGCI